MSADNSMGGSLRRWVTPELVGALYQKQVRRDKALGIENGSIARNLRAYGTIMIKEEAAKVFDAIARAREAQELIARNHALVQELEKKCARSRSKKLRNQYYKRASELLVEAREAAQAIAEVEKYLAR